MDSEFEKDLIDALESLVHKDFPNAERVGCPGREVLARFAAHPAHQEVATLLAHIRQCSPCFDELKEQRRGKT